jgi:hypothetical protein
MKSESIKRNLESLVITRSLGLFLYNFRSNDIHDLISQSSEFAHVWKELEEVALERSKQSGWMATVKHTEFYDAFYSKMSYATQALIIEKAVELYGKEAKQNIELSIKIQQVQEDQCKGRIERKGQSPEITNIIQIESKTTLESLHKNDKFKFNDTVYTVRRKWINDDKPLIAYDQHGSVQRFYYEGLEIIKVE